LTGTLDCSNRGIKTLSSLRYATGLTGLDLSGNEIRLASGLTSLRSAALLTLDLSNNNFRAFPTLSRLTGVKTVDLSDNAITSVRASRIPAALTDLDLSNNLLKTIPDVTRAKQLQTLIATGNRITNINKWGNAPATATINVTNQVVTLSNATVGRRYTLAVRGPDGTYIQPTYSGTSAPAATWNAAKHQVTYTSGGIFQAAVNLTGENKTYALTIHQITGPTVTVSDANLRACLNEVLPADHQITGRTIPAGVLATLTGTLDCSNRGIVSIAGVQQLSGLRELNLSNNAITSVSPIASYASSTLERLNLRNNKIKSVPTVSKLSRLWFLDLSDNVIASISTRSPMKSTSLTTINLSNNKLEEIPVLTSLTALSSLHVLNNSITDLSALADASGVAVDALGQTVELSRVRDNRATAISVIGPAGEYLNVQFSTANAVWDPATHQVTYKAAGTYTGTVSLTAPPLYYTLTLTQTAR
jgi:internalin A